MNPASDIIKSLGGEAVISRVTGTAYTAPYRWQHSRDKGGTDGLIPQRYHPVLLDYARENGIPLKAEDFLPVVASPESDHEAHPERAKAS